MIKRKAKRKDVHLQAWLYAGERYYAGTIENISVDGIYVQFITAPTESAKDFLPVSQFRLELQLPSGTKLAINCESRWINIYITPPDSIVNRLGIQLIDSPQELKDYVSSLP
ncbi:MAG: PilZ domain-containing protein [Nitrospirota bacterium]